MVLGVFVNWLRFDKAKLLYLIKPEYETMYKAGLALKVAGMKL
jgi:hypothetical protein